MSANVGRDDPCPCGSGRKYKRCCLGADEASAAATEAKATEQRFDYGGLRESLGLS